ncbi:hypothetical protein D1BOALGB6SA_2132 [Olavius sp. associated proteobacterium Delta 1]|nr:hypothetical protein D1BOALGB6SA_2132 [Olavius sp. associated proteobacterium Delta 1]
MASLQADLILQCVTAVVKDLVIVNWWYFASLTSPIDSFKICLLLTLY